MEANRLRQNPIPVYELEPCQLLWRSRDDVQLSGDVVHGGLMVGSLAGPLGHSYLDDPWIDARSAGPVNPTVRQQG